MDANPFLRALYEWSEVFHKRSMHSFILFCKKAGVSVHQLGSLMRLYHSGPCAVSDIAAHLEVTSAAASQMLDRLFQQGWIKRQEDPADRRSKQIELTEKGEQLVRDSIQAQRGWMAELAQALAPEKQAELTAALDLLTRAAGRIGEPLRPNCE
jgi:DNA-binding MarR family transcriptional regulator